MLLEETPGRVNRLGLSPAPPVLDRLPPVASLDALLALERPQKEALDGPNNATERAISWWIKERYRSMRGYKVPNNAVGVSRLLAWCGNFLSSEQGTNLA